MNCVKSCEEMHRNVNYSAQQSGDLANDALGETGMAMRKVTIQDIAKELNLSRNTVARALNNSETVAQETRYMVVEKACEMGYPKISPVMLNSFRQHSSYAAAKTIIVLAKQEVSVFWNSIIMGIADTLNQSSCRMRLNFVSEEEERKNILPSDFSDMVGGVICLSVFTKTYLETVLEKKIPTVCLDFAQNLLKTDYPVDVLVSEGVQSVRAITRHLVGQGMRKIAFIGDISCRTIADRYSGYMAGMGLSELIPDQDMIAIRSVPGRYYQMEEIEEYLDGLKQVPEAIVCANDAIAFLVVRALRNRGLTVPQDVAVTGFDNQEELSGLDAFLTTVKVGNAELGKRLAWQLLFRMEHPELPWETVMIDTEVIYRESSAKKLPPGAEHG